MSYHARCERTVRTVGGHIQVGIEGQGDRKDVRDGVDKEREGVSFLIRLTI